MPSERKWLEEDAVYIISDRERQVFLALDSHELRDKFIAEFWRQRDPTPGTEENEFKEEHYRRIAYANAMFGARSLNNGWRTEQGRIYILLGEPQSKTRWIQTPGLKDIEMWFYESGKRIRMTAFFRVMFYRRDFGKDYQLYDPTVDGPEELVEGPHMIAPTREAALNYIQRTAGPELWQAAQTLLPSEPLGMFSGQSQQLLASIDNLRNTSVDSKYAEVFLNTRGYVASRLTFKTIPVHLLAVPLYNQNREALLHVGMEIAPENLKVAKLDTGRIYSALVVKTFINDFETNKPLVERIEHLEFDFSERDGKILPKPVSFAQVLPLVPGKFKVGWIIEDEVSNQFTWHNTVTEIAAPNAARPRLSVPVLSRVHQTLPRNEGLLIHPFRVFNVQYLPRFARLYNMGDDPSVFFEYLYLVSDGKPQIGNANFIILVRKLGGIALPGQAAPPTTEVFRLRHSIPHDHLPANGIVFVHRQIPRDKLDPGDYELVVRAEDSQNGNNTDEQSFRFTFRGTQPLVYPILKEIPPQPAQFGESYLLERIRQYRALGQVGDAIREAEAALVRTGLESADTLNSLAQLYTEAGDRRKALEALRRSLASDPSQADVRARIEAFTSQPNP